jgi:hypothetical protein
VISAAKRLEGATGLSAAELPIFLVVVNRYASHEPFFGPPLWPGLPR